MAKGLRYSKFANRIDVDEFERAIGFEPTSHENGNDIGHCPLPWGLHKHGDTTGKFSIHREKKVFNCWVCKGGSLLQLAMAMNDMDDHEATAWLFQFTKTKEESGEEYVDRIKGILHKEDDEKPGRPFYNERALDKWVTTDHHWFEERGIDTKVVEYFKLGYNPTAKKYPPKRNGKPIDEIFTGPAIVLPHFFKGRLQGWQHRWLTEERPKWVKKYTNTSDFPKEETLWGYDFATKQNNPPIVVESVPTALHLISRGYPGVATFGASFSDQQVKLLRSFQNGVILAADNDDIGREAYWNLAGKLTRYIPVGWISSDQGMADGDDLGDLVSDTNRLDKCIEEAKWVLGDR